MRIIQTRTTQQITIQAPQQPTIQATQQPVTTVDPAFHQEQTAQNNSQESQQVVQDNSQQEQQVTQDNSQLDPQKGDSNVNSTSGDSTPKTGDNANVILYVVLGILAVFGIAYFFILRKKVEE